MVLEGTYGSCRIQDEMIPLLTTCCCGIVSVRTASVIVAALLIVSYLASGSHAFIFLTVFAIKAAGIAQSVLRLATHWTVRRSNPDGGEIFCAVQIVPEDNPALCIIGIGSFLGVKRPERAFSAGLLIVVAMPPPPCCACISMLWGDPFINNTL
jgi:hypothetical protein